MCWMCFVWNLNQKHQRWRDACTWIMGVRLGLIRDYIHSDELFIGLSFGWRKHEVSEYQPANRFKKLIGSGLRNEQWYHVKNAICR